jgi:hypothetical protein
MEYSTFNNDEPELGAALGAPKYYIDTLGLKEGETYAWFPTSGDSMTDNTPKSIPSGSLVLGRWLKLNSVADIPLHQPIVVIIDDGGRQYCMLKSGCKIQQSSTPEGNADMEALCLRSYNPAPRCDDFWMPFSNIKFVFVVEKVRVPNGREFVPQPQEVIRKGRGL